MDLDELKQSLVAGIDSRRGELTELSLRIHANPETAFYEYKAAAWLADYLEDNGLAVERAVCGMPTAFKARYGEGLPVIAILAEYDALPKLGHACGHNLIAAMAVAAGLASKRAVDGFGGSVLVVGTPGEELFGGKALMVQRGCFDGVDVAMMVHPGVANATVVQSLACQTLDVEFFGRAAHAAARPEEGINALDAMLLSFNAINSLRQHIRERCRIHGIITDGGEAANIVPAHTAGNFVVRAENDSYLDELKERVISCFAGAATATGARLEYRWAEVRYSSLVNNQTLAQLFERNMELLGREMLPAGSAVGFGSTDMGNVSQLVPGIHPMVAIVPPGVLIHSPEFAQAATSETAIQGMLDGAKAMAMTVADLLASPAMLNVVRAEFEAQK
ncbi:MAG: M20 family metallopeptidase [Chloroflexi bacterium]|nr:M20 family metallopeptidase [Chloroflexota bacterium]